LTLTPAGVLSGTPTTAGSYVFGLEVTDGAGSNNLSDNLVYSGTVSASVPAMPTWMLFGLAVLLIGIAARRLTISRALGK
jgi:hypothetical protein